MKNKLLPILLVSVVANTILAALLLAPKLAVWKANGFKPVSKTNTTQVSSANKDNLFDEVNPVAGFKINASYGQLGPKMTALGVIDPDKFKSTYEKSNQPLTPEQEQILLKGSDEKLLLPVRIPIFFSTISGR